MRMYCYCFPLDTFEFGFVSGTLFISLMMIMLLLVVRMVMRR